MQNVLPSSLKTDKVPEITLDSSIPIIHDRGFQVGVPAVTISGSVYGLVESPTGVFPL